ncbi:rhodanese-like domain-containing protein [Vibrio renipiscarius]
MKLIHALLLAVLSFSSLSALASERAEKGWQWIDQGAVIVDVRTPQEFRSGHLENAVNYPLSDIAQYITQLDKTQPIVVYCRSGARSGRAYDYLQSQGFTQVHNAGGYVEMNQARNSPPRPFD